MSFGALSHFATDDSFYKIAEDQGQLPVAFDPYGDSPDGGEEAESYYEKLEIQYLKAKKRLRILPERIDFFFEEKLDLEIVPPRLRYTMALLFMTSPIWVFLHLVWLEGQDERAGIARKIREQEEEDELMRKQRRKEEKKMKKN